MGRLGKTELQRVMVESAPEVAAAIDAVKKLLMITTCGSSNNIDNRTIIINTEVIR
jgi:hypothetical protein